MIARDQPIRDQTSGDAFTRSLPGSAQSAQDAPTAFAHGHGGVAPIAFNGCLGWVHAPHGVLARTAGVVIVNGVGRDARCAHRPLRILAEDLAAAGFATLRYDHPGEGDSLAPVADQGLVHAWRDGVGKAVHALKAATGLDRVIVIGLRLGGSLAALECQGVDCQVLLAPVVDGRQWVRELKLAGRMSATYAEGEGKAFEAEGVSLSHECVTALQDLDLTTVRAAAPQVLLAMPRGADMFLGPALESAGARVSTIAFDDFEPLFIDAHSNIAPRHTFEQVVDWLGSHYPIVANDEPLDLSAAAFLRPAGGLETAVSFGEGLKGVLCIPDAPTPARKAVVFCNTGGDPRAGIGGFAATAARRLASDGIASLRFDFAGLGDSRTPDSGDTHVFATDRTADFAAAVTLLWSLGYSDLTVVGVCSGAFHALRAAQADVRVRGVFLVNPIKLTWGPGDSVATLYRKLGKSTRTYLQATSSADTWRRLLRGDIDLRTVGLTLASRAIAQAPSRTRSAQTQALRHGMTQMARRGGKAHFLLGLMDGCLDEVERHFGRRGHMLGRLGMGGLTIYPDLDHGMALSASRQVALDVLVDFVEA